jgi:hypothetical protein
MKRVIKPKYMLESRECEYSFEEILRYVESGRLKIAYNSNNSGGHNFLEYNKLAFEEINDVKEFAMGKPWMVVSTYRENGHTKVDAYMGDDALTVRHNDASSYVIAGDQVWLDHFVSRLNDWVEYGGDHYVILNHAGRYKYGFIGINVNEKEVFEWAKPYGFTMKDIRRVK